MEPDASNIGSGGKCMCYRKMKYLILGSVLFSKSLIKAIIYTLVSFYI
ncbi:MAG: hypothetical protein AB2417_10925 [Clostridiaceae bacterium]